MSNNRPSGHKLARTILALVVLATTAQLTQADDVEPAQFGAASHFAAGNYPTDVVAADFNSDGRPDVAVSAGGLSLLLGSGGGALVALTNYPVFPTALATGDFNGDGKLDLIAAAGYDTRIMLGDGAGNLSVLTNMTGDNSYSVYPTTVAVGDLNGDGQADIAVANIGSTRRDVTVGFGRGDGFFGEPTAYDLSEPPSDIALGDLNGDGWLDAVVSQHSSNSVQSNSVCVLTNTGNGTLTLSRRYQASLKDSHYSLKLADFDGAGGLDLAVPNFNAQSVTIRLNDGSGVFGSATDYPLEFQPTSLAADDFNGDGEVDLFIRGSTNACVLLGHGDGLFTVGSPIPMTSGDRWPCTIAVADFDTNGTPDLAFTCLTNLPNSTVAIMLNETPPVLAITPLPGSNQITWRAAFGTGFTLECTTNPLVPGSWQEFPTSPFLIDGMKAVTDPAEQESKFYRLRKL